MRFRSAKCQFIFINVVTTSKVVMSSKKDELDSKDIQTELIRFIKENDKEPVAAFGDIPEGHEGPYMPSMEEFLKGARQAAKCGLELAKGRADLAEEKIRGFGGLEDNK
jgi:hypothetical protein